MPTGPRSLRRTKPTLIYRRTGNLQAVQLLLSHTKLSEHRSTTSASKSMMRWISPGKPTCDGGRTLPDGPENCEALRLASLA